MMENMHRFNCPNVNIVWPREKPSLKCKCLARNDLLIKSMCYKENKTRAGVDASTPGRGTDAQPWSVLETEPLSCDVGLESNLAPILENCRMRSYHCIESNLCTWMHARVHRGTCKHSTCKRVSAAVDVNVCAGCVRSRV